MELDELRALVAVAEERHFGRAAERLGVTQPAVSQRVRQLELALGLQLFERTSRRVALTGPGEELLGPARAVLTAVDGVRGLAEQLSAGERSVLRVGTTESAADRLGELITRLSLRHPDWRVELQRLHTPAKMVAVRDGALDVAFVREPAPLAGVELVELWSDPLEAVLGGAPGSDRRPIDLADLADRPVLAAPREHNPRVFDTLLSLCRGAGFEPELGPPFDNLEDALTQLRLSGAFLLLPGSVARTVARPAVVTRPLTDVGASATVHLAWSPLRSNPAARGFIELATGAVAPAMRRGDHT